MDSHISDRFLNRADQYHAARPNYPPELLQTIISQTQLSPNSLVADVGSGTGIFTSQLLNYFQTVLAVEPNSDMQAAAQAHLAQRPGYQPHPATAEDLQITDNTLDLIVSAQAFHWFDRTKIKPEWKRALKPPHHVALIWNERTPSNPASIELTEFLDHLANLIDTPSSAKIDSEVRDFLSNPTITIINHQQSINQETLIDLCLSRSYFPRPTDPSYTQCLDRINQIFNDHQSNNQIFITYQAKLFLGTI